MKSPTVIRCFAQTAMLYALLGACGCQRDFGDQTTKHSSNHLQPSTNDPKQAPTVKGSGDELENITIRGKLARQDAKSIVELAKAIPDITQPILSLEVKKNGDVWVETGQPLGGGHLVKVEHVSNKWKVKSVERWYD